MNDISLIISIISILISATTAVVILKKNHEHLRREKAADLIMKWSMNLSQQASLARKYVEQFDDKQMLSLSKQEEVAFGNAAKEKELCENIKRLLSKNAENNNKSCKLTIEESSELRWIIITYLNMLESVFIATMHGIANKKMINDEFGYLYNPKDGEDILGKFRKISDGCYPAIDIFCTEIEKNRQKEGQKPVS